MSEPQDRQNEFPRLEALVAGKMVAVVAKNAKCRTLQLPGQVVIRFHNDDGPADILCTSLLKGLRPSMLESCKLIVFPRPADDDLVAEELAAHGAVLEKPMEFWHNSGHAQLSRELDGYPTSAMCLLKMLESTTMVSCTLYGFDTYSTLDSRASMWKRYRTHKPRNELDFMRRLIASDDRFKPGEYTHLYWPEVWWLAGWVIHRGRVTREYFRRYGLWRTMERIVLVLARPFRQRDEAKPS